MNRKISDIFSYGDEPFFWEDSDVFDAREISDMTMARLHPCPEKRRRKAVRCVSRTMLIAAVLVCLLTVSAFAIGGSIYQRRQAELRQALQVDENKVDSYVEFPLPEAAEKAGAEPDIVILSAIKNGEFETVYVSISPVTREEALRSYYIPYFYWSLDGGHTGSMASPFYDDSKLTEDDFELKTLEDGSSYKAVSRDALERLILESYDEESQSLPLKLNIPLGEADLSQPQELLIKSREMTGETVDLPNGATGYEVNDILNYGTVTLYPIDSACRIINFPEPVEFENTETGGKGRVLGAEIYPGSITWIMEHDDSEKIYYTDKGAPELSGDALRELQLSWINALDRVLRNARLDFENGDSRDISGYLALDYIGGEVRPNLSWTDSLIDINAIISITVGGVEIPIM